MALVFQRNEVDIERTGQTVTVPNNDVARLMYYLNCVCTTIDINDDPDIQRYTNYRNYSYLSTDEQKALVVLCSTFSPDVFDDKVFFHSDALCEDSSNEFYTINQVRSQLLAAESIIIAGRVRHVNKIMTYRMSWMKNNYFDPMQRLVSRFSNSSQPSRPRITHTPPARRESPPTYNNYNTYNHYDNDDSSGCSTTRLCCYLFCCLAILGVIVGIVVGIIFIINK